MLAEPARYLAVLLLARVCAETAAIVLVAAALLHWLGTGWHVFLLIWVIMILFSARRSSPRTLGRQHAAVGGAGRGQRAVPGDPDPRAAAGLLILVGNALTPGPGVAGRVRH